MRLLVVCQFLLVTTRVPYDTIEVGINGPHNRRGQAVTVDIFYITHGEVHGSLVYLARLRFDINHKVRELVVPGKGQTCQLPPIADRCTIAFVGLCAKVTYDEGLYFLHHIAVGIAEDASVIGREDQFHDISGVALELREAEQVDQSHFLAVG